MTKHLSEAERRAQILAAAREEFIREGYAATRVGDVARNASLSKGAIYFYFPSKRDLFMALVLQEHEATYAFLERSEQGDVPALTRLLQVGQQYVDYFFGIAQPPRFWLMMIELAVRDEEIRRETQKLHQRFVDALTRIFVQGMAEGAFRTFDPVAVAQMLKAMIDGIGGQAAIGVAPERERFAIEGFRTILRGVLVDPDRADLALVEAIQSLAAASAGPAVESAATAG